MKDELRPLIYELAHICHSRNELETKRRSAKNKIAYYENIKANLSSGDKTTAKWLNKKSELNKLILKYRADYMKARYLIANHTCKTRKRVTRLTKLLSSRIHYKFGTGSVQMFTYEIRDSSGKVESLNIVDETAMKTYAKEYEADKAVERNANAVS